MIVKINWFCTRFIVMILLLNILSSQAYAQTGNADWMRHVKFGVMVHYLSSLQNKVEPQNMGKITSWDSCVNDFDVNVFASQLHQAGAGYVIFTMYQGSRFICAPNTQYEKITGWARGQATSHRDLIMDLSKALKKYDIKLIIYVTGDGTFRDLQANVKLQNPMMKWAANGNKFKITDAWINNWAAVLKEWGKRYSQIADGWWVDGAYTSHGFNDQSLGKIYSALKTGNSKAVICFNNGVHSKIEYYTKWDTYTAGEMTGFDDLPPAGGRIKGKQWHILSFLGNDWASAAIKYATPDYLINYINKVNNLGGVVSINVVVDRNGSIAPNHLFFLNKISKQIKTR